MRRNVALGLTLLLSLCAAAQDFPKIEVFAGYQLFRVSPSSRANVFVHQLSVFPTNGGMGSVQWNVNSYLGIVGEFGATRSGTVGLAPSAVALDQTQFLYLVGPRMFVAATRRISPFLEFLVGGAHDSRDFDVPNSLLSPGMVASPGVTAKVGANSTHFSTTQNAFATAIGAGVNVQATRMLSIRPLQLDYVGTRLLPMIVPGVPAGINDSKWQMNWKYSAGVTFRFGSRRETAATGH